MTQITTGKVRFSYVNIFEPRQAFEGAPAKYSITLLIPKTDIATYNKIQQAIKDAKEEYTRKNPNKPALPSRLHDPVHDGDGERPNGGSYGEEAKGCWVITATNRYQPEIIDADKNEIYDGIKSGDYGRAVLYFYVYDVNGSRGVTARIKGVQKLEDGEPLGSTSKSVWADL